MTKVIIQAANDFTQYQFGEIPNDEIRILFDDSIFEDKGAEMDRDRLDVQAGIMSVPEYREKWYGEDEDTAKDKYQEYFLHQIIDSYLNALTTGAMTPTQYVEVVFPDAPNKDEIIAYIEDFIGKSSEPTMDFLYQGDDGSEEVEQNALQENETEVENQEEIDE
jgi:hypothetical protein